MLLPQVLAGQVGEAADLHQNWTAAWHRFGWLPEMFEMSLDHRHPTQSGDCGHSMYPRHSDTPHSQVGLKGFRVCRSWDGVQPVGELGLGGDVLVLG